MKIDDGLINNAVLHPNYLLILHELRRIMSESVS
jgi:hypothetical protein